MNTGRASLLIKQVFTSDLHGLIDIKALFINELDTVFYVRDHFRIIVNRKTPAAMVEFSLDLILINVGNLLNIRFSSARIFSLLRAYKVRTVPMAFAVSGIIASAVPA